jgi:hypothetical protein
MFNKGGIMTLYEKIIVLYPELKEYDFCMSAIRLQDNCDGKGSYIDKWEHPTLARPTKEQLEAIE